MLKKFVIVSGLMFLICSIVVDLHAGESKQWAYKYVITTSQSVSQLYPIFKDIYDHAEERDEKTLELLVDVLTEYGADKEYPEENKVWIAKILSRSSNYRYADALRKVNAQLKDSGANFKKVRAASRSYLKKSQKHKVEQYLSGGIDFEAIRSGYINDALSLDVDSIPIKSKLTQLKKGDNIEKMFALAGPPQHVVSGLTRVSDGFLIHLKFLRLTFYYRGQGRVVFGFNKKKGWMFQSTVIDSLAFEEHMPYRRQTGNTGLLSDHGLHLAMLMSNRPASIKTVAEKLYNEGVDNIELLDVAAEVLLTNFNKTEDPVAIDSYAWISKLLSKRGGVRYESALEFVAQNTSNLKLRRYAQSKLSDLAEITTDEYKKGSVSLSLLMGRYPSPYPRHNEVVGRL